MCPREGQQQRNAACGGSSKLLLAPRSDFCKRLPWRAAKIGKAQEEIRCTSP